MYKYQGNEILDVVDMQNNVIGRAFRKEVHEKSLIHRSVHVLVFNSGGDLFLQKRVLTKDENPGLWDSSAAGHLNCGEEYLACAHRELKEELGITATLEPFLEIGACEETLWEHVSVFTCVTDRPIVADPQEISEGWYWPVSEIKKALDEEPGQFTSTFRIIIRLYLSERLQTEKSPYSCKAEIRLLR